LALVTRSRVPRDLSAVTSVNGAAEVAARHVGASQEAIHAAWRNLETLYRSGIHPAIQVCVRRRGQVVLNRSIGHASGNGPNDRADARKVPATPLTPFVIFSASKAITAMVAHLLNQRHQIHLDDPVCEYIPEFGVRKKQWITIRHVLTHRAGMPNLPPAVMNLEKLEDPDGILAVLCDTVPSWRAGRQLAYHAITGGFLIGEIVRRVTGKDIRTYLHDEILQPLGFRWMNYGVAKRDVKRVAQSYFTGPPPVPPLSTVLLRALGVPFRQVAEMSNDPRFLTSIIPSGNTVATADELSRFYQLLLNGGELDGVRIFEPRTIRRAISEHSYLEFDLTLALPIRYGMGFMLGGKWLSLYGPDTQYAFGHLGFTNIISWADPERQVAAAIITSGKPLLYPELYYLWDAVRQIGIACPKEKKRRVPVAKPAKPRQAARRRTKDSGRQRRVG
jgi:CubicO group peptidase (beta-lactamase class C family)